MTPKQVAHSLKQASQAVRATGTPTAALPYIAAACRNLGARRATVAGTLADYLDRVAKALDERPNPSKIKLAGLLRSILADVATATMDPQVSMTQYGTTEEEVRKNFRAENPDMADADVEKFVGHWKEHKDVVKDKAKEAAFTPEVRKLAGEIRDQLVSLETSLAAIEGA